MLDVRTSLKVDQDELIAHMLAAGAFTDADLAMLQQVGRELPTRLVWATPLQWAVVACVLVSSALGCVLHVCLCMARSCTHGSVHLCMVACMHAQHHSNTVAS